MSENYAVGVEIPKWHAKLEKKLNLFPVSSVYEQRISHWPFYHKQPGIEIHITHGGNGTLMIGNQIIPQSAQKVCIFNGTLPHQLIIHSRFYQRSLIHINPDFSLTAHNQSYHFPVYDFSWIPANTYYSFSLDYVKFQKLKQYCHELDAEWREQEPGWQANVLSISSMASVFLQRLALDENPHFNTVSALNRQPFDLVEMCCEHVAANLEKDLTLKTVAQTFHVSEEHLIRCFKKSLQCTYYQFVIKQRIDRAKQLLLEQAQPKLVEIAYSLGFTSSSHFSKTFREMTGLTPSAFRATHGPNGGPDAL